MLIYFVECFIMGFALGLSWASFATPVYLICCFAGRVFDWKIPTALWLVAFAVQTQRAGSNKNGLGVPKHACHMTGHLGSAPVSRFPQDRHLAYRR